MELINTGSELMLGRVLNTHQQWLCRRLADLGCVVSRQVTVADTASDIEQVVREALMRADLVITTGGLGPTSDDLTRDRIAGLLGRPLREDPAIVAHIRDFFSIRRRPMPESTRIQALVPEGAVVLPNPYGTAPGLALEIPGDDRWRGNDRLSSAPSAARGAGPPSKKWLVMLPGPPRELRPMFDTSVVPLLRQWWPAAEGFVCRTLRTTGVGESVVQEKIGPHLETLVEQGLGVGYCARIGQVDVRFSARGDRAAALVEQAEVVVRPALANHLYGEGDEELEAVVVRLLTERKQTLALAESCTGGLIAHRLTNVPGASAVLLAGVVSYSDVAKREILGVPAATLAAHGAVSEPVAREMAEGARRRTGAHFAVSVTGIAGPAGGSEAKPVGTAFIGVAAPTGTVVEKCFNPYDRETFKQATANQALEKLRRSILNP